MRIWSLLSSLFKKEELPREDEVIQEKTRTALVVTGVTTSTLHPLWDLHPFLVLKLPFDLLAFLISFLPLGR